MSPTAEQMVLPSGYGTRKEKLEWGSVNQMLVDAPQYWVASVRPDGCLLSADEEGVNTERPQAKPRTNGVTPMPHLGCARRDLTGAGLLRDFEARPARVVSPGYAGDGRVGRYLGTPGRVAP